MDIMCLMGLFPNGYEGEIAKNSLYGMQNAANKLQWGIVKGLDAQPEVSVRICNSLYVGSYPKRYKKVMIPTFQFEHCGGAKDINVGFLNLPVIKQLSRYVSAKRILKQWAKEDVDTEKVLLVYALTTPFVQLAHYVQTRFPKIKVCIVVPDLPEYMNPSGMLRGGFYAKAKQIEIAWLKHCTRCIRCYVLLTDGMRKWFKHDIQYTVIEGIAPDNQDIPENMVREKTIIYAGGIRREYGVLDLIDAFKQVTMPDWRLVIYGDGSDLELAKESARCDNRIVFMGMQLNTVVVEHQKRASLLVNPRKNEEFTKYSFPSKILEYMSSGTAMLAYRLDGVPREYDDYYYVIDEGRDGLTQSLRRVMEITEEERQQMGNAAKEFVRKNKNPKSQCAKVIELITKL